VNVYNIDTVNTHAVCSRSLSVRQAFAVSLPIVYYIATLNYCFSKLRCLSILLTIPQTFHVLWLKNKCGNILWTHLLLMENYLYFSIFVF